MERMPRSFSIRLLCCWKLSAYSGACGCSSTGIWLCICLYWTFYCSDLPASPACPGSPKWWHTHLVYQPLLPACYPVPIAIGPPWSITWGWVMKSYKKVAQISIPWFHHCRAVFNWTTWHFLQAFTLVSSTSFTFILLSQISSDW